MATSKSHNPGPNPGFKINSKPSGGGRVGPSIQYAANPHPKAKAGGRTGTVAGAMKGQS